MPFAIWLGTLFTPTTIWSSIMGPEIPFCLWAWRSMHCVSRACTHTQSRRSPGLFGLHRRSRWGNHFWSCELVWMTQSTMSAAVGNFVHQLRTDSKSTQGCGIDRCRIRRSSSRYEPLALQAGKLVQFFRDASPDTPALNGCVPRDKQGTELLRRNQSTESAWFAPHQAQAHGAGEDGGYEDINLVSTMHALAMGSPARWCTGSMRRTARLEDRSTN